MESALHGVDLSEDLGGEIIRDLHFSLFPIFPPCLPPTTFYNLFLPSTLKFPNNQFVFPVI